MSEPSSLDDLIRRAATTVLVACIAILGVTAGAATLPAVQSKLGFAASQPARYSVGQKIDLPAAAYSGRPRTVLFFSLSSCGACQRSKSEVAAIAGDLAKHPGVHLLMVTGETFRNDETAFAKSIGIDSTHLLRLDLSKLKLKHVPALVVVNSEGRVLFSQEGVPTDADRRQILSTATDAP